MYHGEVMVSEEQLTSVLSTAKLLQVIGLNAIDNIKKPTIKRSKVIPVEIPLKKIRTKGLKENTTIDKFNDTLTKENITHGNLNSSKQPDNLEIEVKAEKLDADFCADVNENISNQNMEKTSILEAALDSKRSILERSLTAHHSPGEMKEIFK